MHIPQKVKKMWRFCVYADVFVCENKTKPQKSLLQSVSMAYKTCSTVLFGRFFGEEIRSDKSSPTQDCRRH